MKKINPNLSSEVNRRKIVIETNKKDLKYSDIEPSKLVLGPRLKEKLPSDLVSRLTLTYLLIGSILEIDYDSWMDGFLRDHDPNYEAYFWEQVILLHSQMCSFGKFDKYKKQLALKQCMDLLVTPLNERDEFLKNLDKEFSDALINGWRIMVEMEKYIDKEYSDFHSRNVSDLSK